jgi:hypothetical protein
MKSGGVNLSEMLRVSSLIGYSADDFHSYPSRNSHAASVSDGIVVGSEVEGDYLLCEGTVKWLGKVYDRNETLAGVELKLPYGNCDGSYKGNRYFECQKNYGIFIPIKDLRPTNWMGTPTENSSIAPVSLGQTQPFHPQGKFSLRTAVRANYAIEIEDQHGPLEDIDEGEYKSSQSSRDTNKGKDPLQSKSAQSSASASSYDEDPTKPKSYELPPTRMRSAHAAKKPFFSTSVKLKKEEKSSGSRQDGLNYLKMDLVSNDKSEESSDIAHLYLGNFQFSTTKTTQSLYFYIDRVINSELMPSLNEIFQKVDTEKKGKVSKQQLSEYFSTYQMDVIKSLSFIGFLAYYFV